MILMPIVSVAEEIEQMAPSESEQSVSSDSQNQDSNIATEEAENKTKSVDENPEDGSEEKNPEDENKKEEEEPKNKTEGDNSPITNEDSLQLQAMQNSLAAAGKPGDFKARGELVSDLFTGAANYTYTIESPPGRNGLQPTISLSYSSMGAKGVAGVAGVGWNLNLSYVQRNVNYTYRDTEISDDKFELYLFGSKIDLVPDTHGNLIGKYRGKNQPSIYIEASDNNYDNKIDQWIVKQPDGTKLFFGLIGGTDCRIANNFQNRDYTSRWYLKKIQDAQQKPNEIYYNYLTTISNSATNLEGVSSPKKDCGQLYIASIKYNNNKNREILFKYEARPDIIPQFQQGLWVQQCYRLHSIETKVKIAGTPTRINNWQMEYVDDIRSYLEKIHEAPTSDKKYTTSFGYKRGWPNTNDFDQLIEGGGAYFEYYEGSTDSRILRYGFEGIIPQGLLILGIERDTSKYVEHFEFNDIFELSDGSPGTAINIYNFSTPFRTHLKACERYTLFDLNWFPSTSYVAKYIDIDNDGCLDLVYRQSYNLWIVYPNIYNQFIKYSEDNSYQFQSQNWPFPRNNGHDYISSTYRYYFENSGTKSKVQDINGDGYPDFLIYRTRSYEPFRVWINNGNSFDEEIFWTTPNLGTFLTSDDNYNYTSSDGDSWQTHRLRSSITDLNADGLPDFLYLDNYNNIDSECEVKCDWNTGTEFSDQNSYLLHGNTKTEISSSRYVALSNEEFDHLIDCGLFDLNNDGFPDFIYSCQTNVPQIETKTNKADDFSKPPDVWLVKNVIGQEVPEQLVFKETSLQFIDVLYHCGGVTDNSVSYTEIYREPAGTLISITNEIGGVTSIKYEESTLSEINYCLPYKNNPNGPNTRVWRVKEIITENGMTKNDETTHSHYNKQKTEYKYGKVWQDHKEHDYRGHDRVEETVFGENDKKFKTKHYFHQDDYRKGKEYKTQVFDENDNLLRENLNTFTPYWCFSSYLSKITTSPSTWMDAPVNYFFATFLTESSTKFYEISSQDIERQTKSTYKYDIYGNVTEQYNHGDISYIEDDLKIEKSFQPNADKWIINKPFRTKKSNHSGNTLTRALLYYDKEETLDPPPIGNLTRIKKLWYGHDPNYPETTATYDNYGNIKSVTDPNGNTSYTYYDNATHTFPIKSVNSLNHTTTINDFNPGTGQPKKATDPNGLESHFEYDDFHRVTETRTEKSGELLGKTKYTYFDYNVAQTSASAIPAGTKTAVYISKGRPGLWTKAYKYIDGNGNAIQTRTAAENNKDLVSETFYNERGLAYKQPVPFFATKSDGGKYVEPTGKDFNGNSVGFTETEFDALQRPTKTITPEEFFTTTEYGLSAVADTEFAYTKTTNPRGAPIKHYSDSQGNLVKVEEFHSKNSPFLKGGEGDFEIFTTRYTYDAINQLKTIKDHHENIWKFNYDTLGNRYYADDPDRGISHFYYDANGNLERTVDARGAINELDYDALNRITERRNFGGQNVAQASRLGKSGEQLITKLFYDKNGDENGKIGLLNKVEYGKFNTQNLEFNIQCTKSLEYDNKSRVEKTTLKLHELGGNGKKSTSVTYDLADRVKSNIYPEGETQTYNYNTRNLIANSETYNNSGPLLYVEYTYNEFGKILMKNISSENEPSTITTTTYTYNEHPIDTTQPAFSLKTIQTKNPPGTFLQNFTYTYDKNGNVTQISDLVRSDTQTFAYDSLDRLIKGTGTNEKYYRKYDYDAIGNLTRAAIGTNKVDAVANATTYTYGKFKTQNSKLKIFLPHAVTSYSGTRFLEQSSDEDVDKDGLTESEEFNFATNPLNSDTDQDGIEDGTEVSQNITAPFIKDCDSDNIPDGTDTEPLTPNNCIWFSASSATPPKGWWKKYAAQPNAQKQAAEGQFTYDKAGNMTSAFGQKYVWNADGRLQEVHKSGTKIAEYLYDEEGKRIIKYDYKENEATFYVGKLFEISYEIGYAGPKNWVSYYFCNNERVAQNKTKISSQFPNLPTSELLFKHGDHLGSASVQTDSEGNLKQRIQYYPYGGDRFEYEAPGMDGKDIKHRFTDHEKDFTIGIYYAQARYYDQRLGRFISCDPVGPQLENPQSLNAYHYCLNNPIRYIDPEGEEAEVKTKKIKSKKNKGKKSKGRKSQKTRTLIKVSVSLRDESSSNRSQADKEKIANNIESSFENNYSGQEGNHSWKSKMNIKVANSEKDIRKGDHVIRLRDYKNNNKLGRAKIGGTEIEINSKITGNNKKLDRTSSHEMGHSLSLRHPRNNDPNNTLKSKGAHDNKNPINSLAPNNLMRQTRESRGTKIESSQIKQIQKNYNAGKLNK